MLSTLSTTDTDMMEQGSPTTSSPDMKIPAFAQTADDDTPPTSGDVITAESSQNSTHCPSKPEGIPETAVEGFSDKSRRVYLAGTKGFKRDILQKALNDNFGPVKKLAFVSTGAGALVDFQSAEVNPRGGIGKSP
ncbi:hypothetical protein HDU93_005536, partial [Gonapodya sp. JEL0774]